MRTPLFAFLLLGLALLPAPAAEPIRVACLGDSITEGAKVKVPESYPVQLQTLLGAGFVVKNLGRGGATLWHGGHPNAFEELPGATAFAPQIAVVMFGINDTRSRETSYWSHFDEFEADATKLLEALLALPDKPRILLCQPTANFADLPGMPEERKANVAERLPRLVQVRAKWTALAQRYAARGVQLVDLHAATETHPEILNVDGVHLTPAGYKLLAETLRPTILKAAGSR